MPILSISGATSRSGKTSLAVTVARSFPAGVVQAVKFTTTEDEHVGCARGSPCTVCDIDVDFRLITDPAIIEQAGTDTARLAAAGTSHVVWCIARVSALQRAWAAVQARLSPQAPVVIEGSTILRVVRPQVSFFVINPALPLDRWKPTAQRLIPAADFVCINVPAHKRLFKPIDAAHDAARALRGKDDILVVDVQRDLANWPSAAPLERLRELQEGLRQPLPECSAGEGI